EITIAANCNRQTAAAFQCQRCADGNARTATNTAAAIRSEIVERMIEGPARAVPGQRYVSQRCWAFADRIAQGVSKMIDGELVARKLREVLFGCGRGLRTVRPQRGDKRRHSDIGFAIEEHVDRREALIVPAPAIMKMMVERHLKDARGWHRCAKDRFQRSGNIHPVKT